MAASSSAEGPRDTAQHAPIHTGAATSTLSARIEAVLLHRFM